MFIMFIISLSAKDRSDLEVRLTSGESLQAGLLVGADGSHSG